MKGARCPYCGRWMYSAFWQEGEIECIYCRKNFIVEKKNGKVYVKK